MTRVLGDERMVHFRLVQPVFKSLLQALASGITMAAALTSWISLMPSSFRTARINRSRARHRRGRN